MQWTSIECVWLCSSFIAPYAICYVYRFHYKNQTVHGKLQRYTHTNSQTYHIWCVFSEQSADFPKNAWKSFFSFHKCKFIWNRQQISFSHSLFLWLSFSCFVCSGNFVGCQLPLEWMFSIYAGIEQRTSFRSKTILCGITFNVGRLWKNPCMPDFDTITCDNMWGKDLVNKWNNGVALVGSRLEFLATRRRWKKANLLPDSRPRRVV